MGFRTYREAEEAYNNLETSLLLNENISLFSEMHNYISENIIELEYNSYDIFTESKNLLQQIWDFLVNAWNTIVKVCKNFFKMIGDLVSSVKKIEKAVNLIANKQDPAEFNNLINSPEYKNIDTNTQQELNDIINDLNSFNLTASTSTSSSGTASTTSNATASTTKSGVNVSTQFVTAMSFLLPLLGAAVGTYLLDHSVAQMSLDVEANSNEAGKLLALGRNNIGTGSAEGNALSKVLATGGQTITSSQGTGLFMIALQFITTKTLTALAAGSTVFSSLPALTPIIPIIGGFAIFKLLSWLIGVIQKSRLSTAKKTSLIKSAINPLSATCISTDMYFIYMKFNALFLLMAERLYAGMKFSDDNLNSIYGSLVRNDGGITTPITLTPAQQALSAKQQQAIIKKARAHLIASPTLRVWYSTGKIKNSLIDADNLVQKIIDNKVPDPVAIKKQIDSTLAKFTFLAEDLLKKLDKGFGKIKNNPKTPGLQEGKHEKELLDIISFKNINNSKLTSVLNQYNTNIAKYFNELKKDVNSLSDPTLANQVLQPFIEILSTLSTIIGKRSAYLGKTSVTVAKSNGIIQRFIQFINKLINKSAPVPAGGTTP